VAEQPRHYDRVARQIAAGVNRLLPEGFMVHESGGELRISIPGHEFIGALGVRRALESLERDAQVDLEDVANQAAHLLNWLQDLVSEHQRNIWPPARGLAQGQSPLYRAEATGQGIKLWFEVNGTPVTEVVEVPVAL
jgi:hypothetical protein